MQIDLHVAYAAPGQYIVRQHVKEARPASSMKMMEGLAQSSTAMVLQQGGKHVTFFCLGHADFEHTDTRPAALTVSCAAPLTAH